MYYLKEESVLHMRWFLFSSTYSQADWSGEKTQNQEILRPYVFSGYCEITPNGFYTNIPAQSCKH